MSSNTDIPFITFYDVDHTLQPSSRSWSPATVRTYLALQYRQFPFKRQAVSYPDIASVLTSKGIPPAETKSPIKYTLPAITLHYSDGTEKTVMDSIAIAPLLEDLAPASASHPSLFPEGENGAKSKALLDRIEEAVDEATDSKTRARIVPWVPLFLDPRGEAYFERTRSASYKASMAEMRARHADDDLPALLGASLDHVAKVYEDCLPSSAEGGAKTAGGPYLGGRVEPSYADFVTAAVIEWFRCARGDEVVDSVTEQLRGGVLAKVMKGLASMLR